jgi:SRSO17 transposase
VYLAYASPRGRTLADRRLYVPRSWTDDPERSAKAGIPNEVEFATKPKLALDMVYAALDAGMPAGWVAADEVYGNDPAFRAGVQSRGVGYVLAISCDHRVPIDGGKVRIRADILAAGLPDDSWHRLSAGAGSKGPRFYDWAWVDLTTPGQDGHSVLIRRNPKSGELAYYRCWSPRPVPLATLARVAGARWTVEESFQAAKARSDSTLTRYGNGPAGNDSPSWRCSPWPSSPPAPRPPPHPHRPATTSTPAPTPTRSR